MTLLCCTCIECFVACDDGVFRRIPYDGVVAVFCFCIREFFVRNGCVFLDDDGFDGSPIFDALIIFGEGDGGCIFRERFVVAIVVFSGFVGAVFVDVQDLFVDFDEGFVFKGDFDFACKFSGGFTGPCRIGCIGDGCFIQQALEFCCIGCLFCFVA